MAATREARLPIVVFSIGTGKRNLLCDSTGAMFPLQTPEAPTCPSELECTCGVLVVVHGREII